MKKVISFIILLLFGIIGITHNSMMVFAMEENQELVVIESDTQNNEPCMDSCCAESSIDHGIIVVNNNIEKKVGGIKFHSDIIDICISSLYSIKNRNLLNKTPPPYFDRKINNYSYQTLIKIIKTNI